MKRYILFAFVFALGWLGFVNGACNQCNPHGVRTASPQCNSTACHCKAGYTGKNCFKCASGNFWKKDSVCTALPIYDVDNSKVNKIPLLGKCAHDQYTLKHIHDKEVYTYNGVASMEECQKLCRQWANCDLFDLDYRDPKDKICRLYGRDAFLNDDFTNLVITGFRDCPRSDRCVFNDLRYDTKYNIKKILNVEDPYACQRECELDAQCNHFTYSMSEPTKDADTCYLMNATLGKILEGAEKDGLKEASAFVSGGDECAYCFEFNKAFKILKAINQGGSAWYLEDDHWKCQERCFKNDKCLWFQYFSKAERCYLMNPYLLAEQAVDFAFAQWDCDLTCGSCDQKGVLDVNDLTCDVAGNCKCKANYKDKLCTVCEEGYNRLSDGTCAQN